MSKKSKRRNRRRREKEAEAMKLRDMLRPKHEDPIKVYIVSGAGAYNAPYRVWVERDPEMVLVKLPIDADVLLFTGGADICPSIYHQPAHPRTHFVLDRDRHETAMFALGREKFKVGICRGAQLLNCLSGGSLIQHVEGHTSSHDLVLVQEGHQVLRGVPSTHHQMMVPSPNVAERDIVAFACSDHFTDKLKSPHCVTSVLQKHLPKELDKQRTNFFKKYKTSDFDALYQDPEIIFYKNTDSLCIQSHPEKSSAAGPFRAYCSALMVAHVRAHKKRLKLKQENQQKGTLICVDT